MHLGGTGLVQEVDGLAQLGAADGICFILATWLRTAWLAGMNDRGQVGVYLMKGRAKCLPLPVA